LTRESADDSAFDFAAGFSPDLELPDEGGLDRLLFGNGASAGFDGARALEAARRVSLVVLTDWMGGGDTGASGRGCSAVTGARAFDEARPRD